MTEFDIASAIRNYVTSNEGVTNFKLALRQIRDEVDTLRIRSLKELEIQNRYVFSFDQYYQIIEVSTSYDAIKKITTVSIPLVHFRANGKPAIRYLGGINGGNQHDVVTGKDKAWALHSPYTGHLSKAHYEAGLVTFLGKNAPKKVRVEAVFTKPSACKPFNGYDWKSSEYPVDPMLTDMLIGKTAESYIRTYRGTVQPNTQSDMPVGVRQ